MKIQHILIALPVFLFVLILLIRFYIHIKDRMDEAEWLDDDSKWDY